MVIWVEASEATHSRALPAVNKPLILLLIDDERQRQRRFRSFYAGR